MNRKTYDLIESATSLQMPVNDDKFFAVVADYIGDRNPMMRMLVSAFGTAGAARFVSLFNGMTVAVPPKTYWGPVFRDVHIYMSVNIDVTPARDKAIVTMAKTYKMTPKAVLATYEKVCTVMHGKDKKEDAKEIVGKNHGRGTARRTDDVLLVLQEKA